MDSDKEQIVGIEAYVAIRNNHNWVDPEDDASNLNFSPGLIPTGNSGGLLWFNMVVVFNSSWRGLEFTVDYQNSKLGIMVDYLLTNMVPRKGWNGK